MTPHLIFLMGAPGSGKSSVGKAISKEFNFSYIDKDNTCNLFTETLLEANGYSKFARDNCDFYKEVVMDLEYQTILNVAHENLLLGNSVILDAPFLSYFSNESYVSDIVSKHGWHEVNVVVLKVCVNGEVLKQRIIDRGLERDRWKLDNWETFLANLESNPCLWKNVPIKEFTNNEEEVNTEELYRLLDLNG